MSEQKFEIDFFELSFLAEACIPPVPIARHSFWIKLIDVYYHQLTKDQRKELFGWIQRNGRFSLDNEDCRLFYDRYNPENSCDIVAG